LARPPQTTASVRSFPTGSFAAAVTLVCLALAASAVYSHTTLAQLEIDFLESRGQDVLSVLDARTRGRGPGGRMDTAVWQPAMEESLAAHEGAVAFLEVINSGGQVVARAGEERPGLYVFDRALPAPRQGGRRASAAASSASAWRLRVGLERSSAAFITRSANAQVVVAAVAIFALLTIALYLWRTANRYVMLRTQEQEAKHLADLGRMAATLAHEIRNPLGAVKGLSQVASEIIPADHAAQPHMETVVREAERLERLVTDLLQFARPREPDLSRFDLVEAIMQTRDILAPGALEKGVDVQFGDEDGSAAEMWVVSDRYGIRQVLLNVLLNAIQASPDGERVRVSLSAANGSRRVTLDIDDHGPGLQGQAPEELFLPFSTTKTQGSGLGLAVSRQIVERLGGTMSLQDRPGGGGRCTIVLPQESAA